MANSKFAYVRSFELPDPLLPNTYMVFRLDGHSFHRFSEEHGFAKPNDCRALELMDCAAREVMLEFPDIVLAFGESDEYSFLLKKQTALYNRRQAKIVSTLTSYFTSNYIFHWSKFFPDTPLKYPPSFDGRIVLYPGKREVRDYFAWRQADTHINNMYNTVFWALVQKGGKTTTQAHAVLRGTVSKQKHEILFSQFGINYNTIDERYKKGSVLVRTVITDEEPGTAAAPTGTVLVSSLEASPQQEEGTGTGKREITDSSHGEGVCGEPGSSVTQRPGIVVSGDLGGSAAGNLGTQSSGPVDSSASDVLVDVATSREVDERAGQPTASTVVPSVSSFSEQPEHTVIQAEEAPLKEEKLDKGDNKSELISTISETSPNAHLNVSPLPTEKTRNERKDSKEKAKKAVAAVKTRIDLLHCDIIKDAFWDARPDVLDD